MNTEKINIPEKKNLKELVNYQDGSIVSNVLLKKNTGNITIFAFAKGEGLSEHTAPFDAFLHVLEGEAEVTISGNKYSLFSDEAIIMPANEPHSVSAISQFKMMLIMIKS